jgi:septal ring-binding cell division protein DamX
MPRFNLKDEETNPEATGLPESGEAPVTPTLREVGAGGGRISPIFLILLILVILAAGVFALNYFQIIDLWGKKAPVVTETMPETDLSAPGQALTEPGAGTEALPLPEAKKPVPSPSTPSRDLSIIPTGTGKYTIQFSAWNTKAMADDQASKLVAGGYEAFVDQSAYQGETWYRVRIGRYDSRGQAREVIAKLQDMTEDEVWVASQSAR